MPIVIRLDRELVERKITLTELSERVGITVANLSILKTGKAKAVRLSTLESICQELDCQPGDILEYVADDGVVDAEGDRAAEKPHRKRGPVNLGRKRPKDRP
jgi:putative transcriptional regulator